MKIGDVVIPARDDVVLACGSGRYTHAIVASVDPFVLVSECGDMLWRFTPDALQDFIALCEAHPRITNVATKRLAWETATYSAEKGK